jgi:hypothetical protein
MAMIDAIVDLWVLLFIASVGLSVVIALVQYRRRKKFLETRAFIALSILCCVWASPLLAMMLILGIRWIYSEYIGPSRQVGRAPIVEVELAIQSCADGGRSRARGFGLPARALTMD